MTRRFVETDLEPLCGAVDDAAAREILPRFGRLTAAQVRHKSSAFDVVTEADEAAERLITGRLLAAFPGAVVIGEEATARDPALLERIGDARLAFVVDPLDGTRNFACGVPLFGVMVAAIEDGEVSAGIIHDPFSRSTAIGLRGAGAWVIDSGNRDGRARTPLRVAPAAPPREMEGSVSTNFMPEPLRSRVNANLSSLAMTHWFRCAAHEYRLAAAGHSHVLLYNKLMPWDHAAGWLIHREAGGYSAHFDASPYRPTHLDGGLLCTPDEASWHAVHRALFSEGPHAPAH